ncbi:MAG: hypothetical protein PVS3B2_15580 [Candidatus Dormibacteraceae bacterium]
MRRTLISFGLATLLLLIWPATASAATIPRMGTAATFAVLAAAGITNAGTTTITGNVGTYPTPSETGFAGPAPNTVTILSGTNHAADAVTQLARIDQVTAFNDLSGQTPCIVQTPASLDNRVYLPGCYTFSSSAILNVGQTVTLNGFGVYVFQVGSDLTIGNGTTVLLTGGAQACGVFWVVQRDATVGTAPTSFQGTMIAGRSISVNTGAVWGGRALAGALDPSGAVTLLSNTIAIPPALCGSLPVTGGGTGTVVPGSTGVPEELMHGQFPWLLFLALGAGIGATALGLSGRRRRRRQS